MNYVLSAIDQCRDGNLRIIMHRQSLERAIMVLEAINELRIEPDQNHVEGHIVGHISHTKITPSEMVTAHRAFGDVGEASRIWKVLIHQTVSLNHPIQSDSTID